jgi:hypothetical protein
MVNRKEVQKMAGRWRFIPSFSLKKIDSKEGGLIMVGDDEEGFFEILGVGDITTNLFRNKWLQFS